VFGAAVVIQFFAPLLWLVAVLGIFQPDPGWIMLYVLVWVAVGVTALFVPSGRSPYLIGAFCLAYVGGLFMVIALTTPSDGFEGFNVVAIGGTYTAALVVLVLYVLRESAIRRTREIGVDTVGTVISAPVSGRVNYVTRQRLTVRFTDQQGVERFLRAGRTGGGWAAGDTVPIRYDPTRPGYRRGIIVDGSGPTLFS
jgi:hypothetical protein